MPDRAEAKLKPGDMILSEASLDDLVMTRYIPRWTLRGIAAAAQNHAPLRIIRGDQALDIVP
jgi:hypothetical protein